MKKTIPSVNIGFCPLDFQHGIELKQPNSCMKTTSNLWIINKFKFMHCLFRPVLLCRFFSINSIIHSTHCVCPVCVP